MFAAALVLQSELESDSVLVAELAAAAARAGTAEPEPAESRQVASPAQVVDSPSEAIRRRAICQNRRHRARVEASRTLVQSPPRPGSAAAGRSHPRGGRVSRTKALN